jgi:hypothetical protein
VNCPQSNPNSHVQVFCIDIPLHALNLCGLDSKFVPAHYDLT